MCINAMNLIKIMIMIIVVIHLRNKFTAIILFFLFLTKIGGIKVLIYKYPITGQNLRTCAATQCTKLLLSFGSSQLEKPDLMYRPVFVYILQVSAEESCNYIRKAVLAEGKQVLRDFNAGFSYNEISTAKCISRKKASFTRS